jgi:hypothetical protein
MIVTLGPHSHAGCPNCRRRIAFFRGTKNAFISEERRFAADSVLQLECPAHGEFEVLAEEFVTEIPEMA